MCFLVRPVTRVPLVLPRFDTSKVKTTRSPPAPTMAPRWRFRLASISPSDFLWILKSKLSSADSAAFLTVSGGAAKKRSSVPFWPPDLYCASSQPGSGAGSLAWRLGGGEDSFGKASAGDVEDAVGAAEVPVDTSAWARGAEVALCAFGSVAGTGAATGSDEAGRVEGAGAAAGTEEVGTPVIASF
jgi:hypothetical protein